MSAYPPACFEVWLMMAMVIIIILLLFTSMFDFFMISDFDCFLIFKHFYSPIVNLDHAATYFRSFQRFRRLAEKLETLSWSITLRE